MIHSFALTKRAICSKKFVFFTMFMTVFNCFSPFYAQERIAPVALCSLFSCNNSTQCKVHILTVHPHTVYALMQSVYCCTHLYTIQYTVPMDSFSWGIFTSLKERQIFEFLFILLFKKSKKTFPLQRRLHTFFLCPVAS